MDKKTKVRPERKQTIITGVTRRMLEYDAEQQEEKESAVIREIVKEHYRLKPPLGFFKDPKR